MDQLYKPSMPYRALTIDTTVAYGVGFDFEHGLLAQLRQFHGGGDRFVLSAIVEAEMLKQLRVMTTATRDKYLSVSQDAKERRLLPTEVTVAIDALTSSLADPDVAARAHMDAFVDATGARRIPVDLASMTDLARLYFENAPPFEAAGAKKAEFPDAIALLSLEAWARQNGKVLAVSKDNGWQAFAEKSQHLDVFKSLGEALAVFQEQAAAEKAAKDVAAIIRQIISGELPELAANLQGRIESRTEELDPEIAADSPYQIDYELSAVAFEKYEFAGDPDDDFDVTVVRLDERLVVVTAPVVVRATFQVSFHLLQWDSTDREYVSLGSHYEHQEAEFLFDALITLVGDVAAPETLDLQDVELVNGSPHLDFGEVEPDFGDR
jgi:PIN domain